MRALRLSLTAVALLSYACGSTSNGASPPPGGDDAGSPDGDASTDSGDDATLGDDAPTFGDGGHIETGPARSVSGITVAPGTSTLVAMNGTPASQQFTTTAQYTDGTTGPLTGANWSRDQAGIGSIDGTGYFTASGQLGGIETITATYGTFTATATLTVQLHFVENPGHLTPTIQGALQGTTTPDPVVKWAYPYDGSLIPRGINETTLMWLGAAPTDLYYVHVKAATFELESFTDAPQLGFDFTTTAWASFTNSTAGPAEVTVARWDGTQATRICDLHWTIANGSMRGTIYYAAYEVIQGLQTGHVVRIKPGATAYDDFLGGGAACPACHTVSANGSQLIMNQGAYPPETSYNYDLKANANVFSGFTTDAGASQWAVPALSPDGTVVVENFAPLYGNIGVQTGAFDAPTGAALTGTGLEGQPLAMPSFAPDGKLLAYVDPTTHDLRAYDWDPAAKKASSGRLIVASSANPGSPQIQYPTVSPDHLWILYQRGPALGSLGIPGDLYVASVANPGTEISLDALNGSSYPFAAGNRDRHLDYEPTFAPVAAGGYFWIVFHSRRTWGNKLTQPAYVSKGTGVKQLWIAGFDQSPVPGTDPSHPAFYLGGQNPDALNTRGYWALSPCEPNGQPCQTGTDCCGGFCDTPPDGGAPVCENQPSGGCSQNGDKCAKAADCCNAGKGVVCINNVCSEPPPAPDGSAQ